MSYSSSFGDATKPYILKKGCPVLVFCGERRWIKRETVKDLTVRIKLRRDKSLILYGDGYFVFAVSYPSAAKYLEPLDSAA